MLDNGPKRYVMHIGRFYYLTNSGIANATRRIVDDAAQCLLIVWIRHDTKISDNILDFLALIERQSSVDAIRNTVLTHLFLERTTLCISTIKDGKVAVFSTLLPTNPLDVVTDNNSFLLVAIGWF